MSHVVHATGLPVSYSISRVWWRGVDLNHRRRTPTDLQSVPFGHSGTPPLWSWRWDLNPQPADYKSAALPIELRQRLRGRQLAQFFCVCQVLPSSPGHARVSPVAKQGHYPHCPTECKPFFSLSYFFCPALAKPAIMPIVFTTAPPYGGLMENPQPLNLPRTS